MNCDRDTPWLSKEDCSDQKVYSKEGATGTCIWGWGQGGAWEYSWVEGEAGMVASNIHPC